MTVEVSPETSAPFRLGLSFSHLVVVRLERMKTLNKIGNEVIFVPNSVQGTDAHIWNREDLG